jgi:DNA mismatch endonuclease (patch repair protein)
MADKFTKEERSRIMRAVRGKGTHLEEKVAALLRAGNVEFIEQAADLPGRPDFYVPQTRTAIFVHGCFWHGHTCPKGSKRPASNTDFWEPKLDANKRRDRRNARKLRRSGVSVFTLWECKMKNNQLPSKLLNHLDERLRSGGDR